MEDAKPNAPLIFGKPTMYSDWQRARDKEMMRTLVAGLTLQGLLAQNAYTNSAPMVERAVELTDALFGKLGV